MQIYKSISRNIQGPIYNLSIYLETKDNNEIDWEKMMANTKLWFEGYLLGTKSWPEISGKEFNALEVLLKPIMTLFVSQKKLTQLLDKTPNLSAENFYKETIQTLMINIVHIHNFWKKYKKQSILPSMLGFQANTNVEILISSAKIFRDQWW